MTSHHNRSALLPLLALLVAGCASHTSSTQHSLASDPGDSANSDESQQSASRARIAEEEGNRAEGMIEAVVGCTDRGSCASVVASEWVRGSARCMFVHQASLRQCRARPQDEAHCAAADGAACRRLGLGFFDRYRDSLAVEPLARSCDTGAGESCFLLGQIAERVSTVNAVLALDYYSRACEAGVAEGCVLDAEQWFSALDSETRTESVERDLAQCQRGVAFACELAATRMSSRLHRDPDEARVTSLYVRGCDLGSGQSCAAAASRLRRGVGGHARLARIAVLHEHACAASVLRSCVALIELHEGAEPSVRDPGATLLLLRKLCDEGIMGACARLAQRGEARAPQAPLADPEPVAARVHSACAAEEFRACRERAMVLLGGGPDQVTDGVNIYQRTCEAGDGQSCEELALEFAIGGRVTASSQRAHDLKQLACDSGLDVVCESLEREANP